MSAGGAVASYMHFDLPLDKTNMLAAPTQGSFGIPNARVIAPGDPLSSVLLYRLCKLGGGRMPRLGSNESDLTGISLIRDWIASMDTQDRAAEVARLRSSLDSKIVQLVSSEETAKHSKLLEELLNSTAGALTLQNAIDDHRISPKSAAKIIETGSQHREEVVRDLFERFLPEEKRVKRLGSFIVPDLVLSLHGDIQNGRKLFFESQTINCKNCHRVGELGISIGPDLTQIGSKLTTPQILENILEPSKQIDPKFQNWVVQTVDGKIETGILVEDVEGVLRLRNAKNEQITLKKEDIESAAPSHISMMPEQLASELTAQQLADLIAYLQSLKKSE
jgi:putative heme-binding domain-containing protein